MRDLLPVLVADLAEDSARDFLREVAAQGGEAWVPLLAAPMQRAPHLLEVYTPGNVQALVLLAEPLGPPGDHGFPLRLSPYEPAEADGAPHAPHAPYEIAEDETTSPFRDAVGAEPGEGSDRTIPQMSSPVTPPSSFPSKPPAAPTTPPSAPQESGRFDDDEPIEQTGPKLPRLPIPMPLPPPARPPRVAPPARRIDTPTAMKLAKPAGAARKPATHTISKEHSADLSGEPPPPPSVPSARDGGLVGRKLAGGKLEVESLVGAGSIGSVYRARHRDLKIPVAVKVLHESFQHDVEFCQRFYAEALAASRLDHGNIVRVYDYGQEPDGLLYLSMEFLDGITLRSLLQRRSRLSVARIVEMMMHVCAGLSHACARGVVHRDLKPDNIMLVASHDDEGRLAEVVKVSNLGLTAARGAPEYMSPEQCRNEPADEQSLVYTCGILLFELATGRVPFTADKPITVVNRQLSMPPPSIGEERPDLDARLDRVIQIALKKSRDDRYQTIRELRADLKALLVPEDSESASPSPPAADASLPPSQPVISIPPPTPAPVVLEPMQVQYEAPPPIAVAHAAPASDPKPASSKKPEWLEDSSAQFGRFFNGMAAGAPRAEEVTEILQRDPKPWLAKFVEERDPRAFVEKVAELDRAVRVLAHKADAKALWAVSSAVNGLVAEGTQGPNTRAARAAKLIQLFTDPGMLGPIAERLLTRNDDAREAARSLIVRARVAGAYALYGARVKHARVPDVREPFVATMQLLGEHAWPVVRAALERIPPTALTGDHPLAADLAEDLLLCVPDLRDEAAGHLVSKFVRSSVPALAGAATRALARLWAERAQPLLLGLLNTFDDGVRVAAVAGLREIGAVDEHVARRLAMLVAPGTETPEELRAQALAALSSMTEDAKPIAVPILVKLMRDPQGADDETVLEAARTLASVMGREAMAVIHDRAERSQEPLRSHLRAIVKHGTSTI